MIQPPLDQRASGRGDASRRYPPPSRLLPHTHPAAAGAPAPAPPLPPIILPFCVRYTGLRGAGGGILDSLGGVGLDEVLGLAHLAVLFVAVFGSAFRFHAHVLSFPPFLPRPPFVPRGRSGSGQIIQCRLTSHLANLISATAPRRSAMILLSSLRLRRTARADTARKRL